MTGHGLLDRLFITNKYSVRFLLITVLIIASISCFTFAGIGIVLSHKPAQTKTQQLEQDNAALQQRNETQLHTIERLKMTPPTLIVRSPPVSAAQEQPKPSRVSKPRPSSPRKKIAVSHQFGHHLGLTDRLSKSANENTKNAIRHFEEITR